MNKIYKINKQKNSHFNLKGFFGKAILFLIGMIGYLGNLQAQVDIGGTPYPNLKAAFDAINAGAKTGVITININANTNEPAMAILNSNGTGSARYSSVLIRPTVATVSISGDVTPTVVKLMGADNVTIDGDDINSAGINRNLTINNLSSSNGTGVIWVGSASASDGATNNIIKNCNLVGNSGTTTLVVLGSSSGTTFGGVAETDNANNSYLNNAIRNGRYGLAIVGPSTGETNAIISNNVIGSANPSDKIGYKSMFVSNQTNFTVNNNTIFGVESTDAVAINGTSGLTVVGSISGGSIYANKIFDIKNVNNIGWNASGITLNSNSSNTGTKIYNNFIYDIAGYGLPSSVTANGHGIEINNGGGYEIQYNSVSLNTDQVNPANSECIYIGALAAGSLIIRNNIFSNTQTTGTRYAIYSAAPISVYSVINNNDYYSSGGTLGFLGSTLANIAAWRAVTGQDANSVSVDPVFVSAVDLHLSPTSPLNGLATPVAGITNDIDLNVRDLVIPDIGADEFTPPNCSSNAAGVASATFLNICASGSTTLFSTGYATGLGVTYQWEFFNGAIWVPLAGQTSPFSAIIGSISATTQYRLKVICSNCCASAAAISNTVTIVVNNPQVTSTVPGSRCGTGTVTLAATAAAGTLNWYAAASGGSSLFTGSPYTTPVINSTTGFFVSNTLAGPSTNVGATYTGTSNNSSNVGAQGIAFTTTQPNISITAVDIPFTGDGFFNIQIKDVTNTTVIASYTTAFVTGSGTTPVTVPLNLTVTNPGSYLLIVNSILGTIGSLGYSTGFYPYTALAGTFSITSGYWFGVTTDNMYLFNLEVNDNCEGLRTQVNATINPPPVFTTLTPPAGPSRTICGGTNVNLNVTSANAGYVYTWNPGNLTGPAHVVTPAATTTYTLTANDGVCRRDSIITITVNPTPSNLSVNPATATVCANIITPIVSTGGQLIGQTLFAETFETFPLTTFITTGVGVTASANTTYYQQGSKSVHLTHANSIDGQLAMTTGIDLTAYSSPKLSFYHICALESPNFDFGYIQYSTNGGGTWFSFPVASYLGSGTLYNGVVSFDKTSYPDWNTQFTSSTSDPGLSPATSLWKLETIDLSAYQTSNNFKVRFRLTADVSVIYYGWLIDNVKINGDGQAPVTWSPTTELFSDAIATIPYVGQALTTVYSKPTANRTYTATATGGIGCNKTATSVLTVTATSAASVTITAAGGTNICAGSPVTFTATPVNGGGNPGFLWRVNGVQVNLPLGYNQNPFNNPYTINGLVNGDLVTCEIFSNGGACINPNIATSNTLTMTVTPKPTVSIDGPLTVCFPANLTLTTTGVISTYQWFLGNLSSPVGINAPTYTALVAGTYYCIVTTAAGCKDTSAAKILTQQTYTITASATNGTISPNGAVIVNCGANQVFTYTANPGGFAVCDVLINGISVGTPASPYTFTNVTSNQTISVLFCISGCATPSVANAGPDVSICANINHTLAGSISGPPGLTAVWTSSGTGTFNPNNAFATATSYTPSAAEILAGTATLTLTTNNPLGAPCAPAVSTMILTIKPVPVVTTTGRLGICSLGSLTTTLTANATITSGTITGYQWFNNVPTLIGAVASQLISVAGNYSVTATASNGCTTNLPLVIASYTSPSTPTITGSSTICAGTTINLTANVASPGNGGATLPGTGYQWFNPASIVGAVNQVYTVSVPATYTVTVTNSNGCLSAASAPQVITFDNSPLNGVYTIGVGPASCTNYVSFATAISDLNTRTIGGNVLFNVPAGYTETAPSPGLALGSAALNPTVAGRTITFIKSGAGANPVINAYVGTQAPSAAIPDGLWSLRGVDNVTIDGIDLNDGNAANPATMEYGFGLFKLSATDGAQNNTIQNCTITLKRVNNVAGSVGVPMPDGSTAILVMNSLATTATVAIVTTSAAGANSNNKFYTNTVQNCNTGIALMGFAAASAVLGDNGNDIGGIAVSTGNNILNYGGAVASTTTAIGVRLNNQWGANVSYNTINNNNGSGVSHTNSLRGIWGQSGGTSANLTINNNNITLKSLATGASSCIGIENAIGSTAAGNTVSISNNIITGTYTSATTGSMTGITNTATAATVNIVGNTVDNFAMPGTGAWTGIINAAATTNVNINNNILQNCNITSTGTIAGLSNTAIVTNLSLSGNTVTGNTKAMTAAISTVNWMQTSNVTNAIVNDNIVSNNIVTAAGFNVTVFCIGGGTSIYTFNNNLVYNNSITGITTGVATLTGYNNAVVPTSETITNNTVRKLFITGTSTSIHILQGINSNTVSTSVKTISNNNVDSLYCSSGLTATVYGIRSGQGTTINIFRNKVHSLFPGQSATAGSIAVGIRTQTGLTTNIYNNFINLDLGQAFAPAANSVLTGSDNLKGIEYTSGTAGNVANIYYNTIRLAGSGSGALFGSSGISIFSATPTVDLRNNIIVNLTTPGGTSPGLAVAYRRTGAVGATYATTSNNNLFYSGVPSASRVLYFDGATSYQTLAAYQAGVGISPRETASVTNLPNFVNIVNPIDLHLVAGSNCTVDGAGAPIGTYLTDYDADTRNVTTPDIGADEFAGTGVGVGVWKGVNNNWMDIQNWCDAIPDIKTNVTIPSGAPFYPLITTAAPVANNITIVAGGSVTITGVGKLGIAGTMTNGGTFNVVDGTIEMLGTTAQTIPATIFQNNDLKNLIISNTAASPGVTLGGALKLYGKLSFTGNNKTFTTAGFLTLRSTATGTASVGDITSNNVLNNANVITGDVSVERFASARRAWRFLSVPTQNNLQTIKESWQENQAAAAALPVGYGTQISKDSANWAAYGFDNQTTPGPSMKTYVPATNNWKGITSTVLVPGVSDGRFVTGTGYMVMVRGDRTVTTFPAAATTTVLRSKGALVTGTFASPAIGAGLFAAIGNPYASAVDFNKLTKTNLQDNYYMWDPQLGTLGGYQTFTGPSPYLVTPGGGSYPTSKFIESGQAFFVRSSGPAGTLSFPENSKVDGSNLVARPTGPGKQLRTNIYVDNTGTLNLFDGVLNQFDAGYSGTIDNMDALKLTNFGENLGIKKLDSMLSVERMPELTEGDTIFYNLANVRVKDYQFEFIAENIDQPGLTGFLEDRYLQTSTVVSLVGTTKVNFSVINDPGSYAADRFRLVFKQTGGPVPVTFTSVRASKQNKDILVEWKVENELNIHHYDVEKSANGRSFSKVGEQQARGTGTGSYQYSWLDTQAWDGDNYYRIRSVGINSEAKQSQVVKVNMGKLPSSITIFPNPVREDGMLYVNLDNKAAGTYQVKLLNAKGQTVMLKTLNHAGGSSVYSILMDKLVVHGNYLVSITGEDNNNFTFKVVF